MQLQRSMLRIGLAFILLISLNSCALRNNMTVWASKPLLTGTMKQLMSEKDLEIAKSAIEADLKILEGLLEVKPHDRELNILAAFGFAGYALLFVEDGNPKRSASFFDRSRNYALNSFSKRNQFREDMDWQQFRSTVKNLKHKDLESAYWLAMSWSNRINFELNNPKSIAEFPRVLELMKWVYDHDSSYFYAGPQWFMGTYYATFPAMFGGDLEKSKQYFENAINSNGKHFLYGKYLYATAYAVNAQQPELFKTILEEIINYNWSGPAELNLLNKATQKKAEVALQNIHNVFYDLED